MGTAVSIPVFVRWKFEIGIGKTVFAKRGTATVVIGLGTAIKLGTYPLCAFRAVLVYKFETEFVTQRPQMKRVFVLDEHVWKSNQKKMSLR